MTRKLIPQELYRQSSTHPQAASSLFPSQVNLQKNKHKRSFRFQTKKTRYFWRSEFTATDGHGHHTATTQHRRHRSLSQHTEAVHFLATNMHKRTGWRDYLTAQDLVTPMVPVSWGPPGPPHRRWASRAHLRQYETHVSVDTQRQLPSIMSNDLLVTTLNNTYPNNYPAHTRTLRRTLAPARTHAHPHTRTGEAKR